MDWLKTLILRVLLVLTLGELLTYLGMLSSTRIIEISVKLLPKDYRERYSEEFKYALNQVNGPICKLIYSFSFFLAAFRIRQALLNTFTGEYAYKLWDYDRGEYYAGTCTLHPSLSSREIQVRGYLLEEKLDIGCSETLSQVKIPWRSNSTSIVLKENSSKLLVDYTITIHNKEIDGRFEVSLDPQNNIIRGRLSRWPVKNGSFYLFERKDKPLMLAALDYVRFNLAYRREN